MMLSKSIYLFCHDVHRNVCVFKSLKKSTVQFLSLRCFRLKVDDGSLLYQGHRYIGVWKAQRWKAQTILRSQVLELKGWFQIYWKTMTWRLRVGIQVISFSWTHKERPVASIWQHSFWEIFTITVESWMSVNCDERDGQPSQPLRSSDF